MVKVISAGLRDVSGAQKVMGKGNYTVNHKKRDFLFLTITLANLNRFL